MKERLGRLASVALERFGPPGAAIARRILALPVIRSFWALAVEHLGTEHTIRLGLESASRDLLLRRVPRFEHGSFVPGVPGWRSRWREAEGRRVLLYAPKDYAGSFLKWARAINEHTDWAARVVAFQGSQYDHDLDLVLPQPGGALDSAFYELLEEADVVHVKDECLFTDEAGPVPPRFRRYFDDIREQLLTSGKPLVFTHYGGYARSLRHDPAYRRAVLACAGRVTMTPDLAYEWFDGAFIPHLIDTDRFPYSWRETAKVSHSPSTRARKGTEIFLEATRDLPLEVEVIEGVAHAECLARKRGAGLFFDQAGAESNPRLGIKDVIGWYGNSALEAAVYGVPTVAHLSEEAFVGARRCGKDIASECAIINTPRDPAGMRAVIVAFFESSPTERRELSERTRAWVESFHGFRTAGQELVELYEQCKANGRPTLQQEPAGVSGRQPAGHL